MGNHRRNDNEDELQFASFYPAFGLLFAAMANNGQATGPAELTCALHSEDGPPTIYLRQVLIEGLLNTRAYCCGAVQKPSLATTYRKITILQTVVKTVYSFTVLRTYFQNSNFWPVLCCLCTKVATKMPIIICALHDKFFKTLNSSVKLASDKFFF